MTIPSGYAQATWGFSGAGVPLGAVVTAGIELGGATRTPTEIATELFAAFGGTIMAQLHNDVALTSCLVKFGPDETGPSGVFAGAIAGSQTDEAMTPNVAFLVRKSTAMGGRAGRGRFYLPGVPENSANEAGVVTETAISNMQSELDDFVIEVGSADLNLVVLHGVGSPLTTPTPVTDLQIDGRVATQRRRLRR